MQLKFKRLSDKAVLPTYAHPTDAGMDLTATRITTEIGECGQLVLVYHTDLAVEIPEGYFGLLTSRSSISKKSMIQTNCVGTIDAGYRGELMAKFKTTTDVIPAVYKEGERFAQLIVLPLPKFEIVEAEELAEGDRGENGYGSTGDATETPVVDATPEGDQDMLNPEAETIAEVAA